jgi:hypothetical protein
VQVSPEFFTNLIISTFYFRIVDTVLAGILNLAATSFSHIPLSTSFRNLYLSLIVKVFKIRFGGILSNKVNYVGTQPSTVNL